MLMANDYQLVMQLRSRTVVAIKLPLLNATNLRYSSIIQYVHVPMFHLSEYFTNNRHRYKQTLCEQSSDNDSHVKLQN